MRVPRDFADQLKLSERFRLRVCVHLILLKEEKILLLRRANTGYEDGNYSVIAGHLDGGETVTEAMSREALEEGGIVIEPRDLTVVHVMHRNKEDGESIDVFLTAATWTGEPIIGEPDKCDELGWFSLAGLPCNVIPYVRAALINGLTQVMFSEFGWN